MVTTVKGKQCAYEVTWVTWESLKHGRRYWRTQVKATTAIEAKELGTQIWKKYFDQVYSLTAKRVRVATYDPAVYEIDREGRIIGTPSEKEEESYAGS